MGKSKKQTLNDNTNAWLDGLARTGLDTTFPMPAMGPLFTFVTSGFGHRDGKAINALASSNHEAHDMTVVTRKHYDDTKKYPLLRASLDHIFVSFPGLRAQFDAQIDQYKTPDDIKNVPVKSMVGGVVLYTGEWNGKSGESVMIGGDDGRMYSYAHVAKGSYMVKEGQRVERGQDIALMDKPTGNTSGKCIHVVNRLLPFAGREGEAPDFKRWSYIHRDADTGRVPAEVFAKALAGFRAAHGGKITYEDLPKQPGTFLYNDNPQVGEAQRPAFKEDIAAKPQSKKVQLAKAPAAPKDDRWFPGLQDVLCDWTGMGCAVPAVKTAEKPKAKEAPSGIFSGISTAIGALMDVDFISAPAQPPRNATKPVASVPIGQPVKHR